MDLECYRIKVSEFHLYGRFLNADLGNRFYAHLGAKLRKEVGY